MITGKAGFIMNCAVKIRRITKFNLWLCLRCLCVAIFTLFWIHSSRCQIENVPVGNQVYEFLDRMGVRGILPLYSNTMVPLSRIKVAELLLQIKSRKENLTSAENQFLEKFMREFMQEIDPSKEDVAVLLKGSSIEDILSDKEKYVYAYHDSSASMYAEFLGVFEHRAITGDLHNSTNASFEQHGGRIRGTVKNRLGYYLQATNGSFFGDKAFAVSDPRLRGNIKFNNLNSPYFDFTEGYLRADLSWFNVQFGREYTLLGTGYSGRLLLSDNAPVLDFLKVDAQYKSFKFEFIHASLVGDSAYFGGVKIAEPIESNKYLALHRVQFSAFDMLNLGVSEMIIYQRFSPEFAYLNPVNFYKSAEHSLGDRDNAFLNFDAEFFPGRGFKIYGTWLIDDIDFSKIGTGWWGNEFAWQGGLYAAEVAGLPDLDAVVEYTRIEPYVYSNRIYGNDYSHNNIGLGHHLEPNSDEWFLQLAYRPLEKLRTWITYTRMRHGDNIIENGHVVKNVGGNLLQGHRDTDADIVRFLEGNLLIKHYIQLRAAYEFVNNFFLTGVYEYRRERLESPGITSTDHYFSIQARLEY